MSVVVAVKTEVLVIVTDSGVVVVVTVLVNGFVVTVFVAAVHLAVVVGPGVIMVSDSVTVTVVARRILVENHIAIPYYKPYLSQWVQFV